MAATSRQDGYFCPLLHWASYGTPMPYGRLVHRYNTSQEVFGFLVTNSGPVDGPASAAAAACIMADANGSPMITVSKASCWAHCCAMATGIY